MTTIGQERKKHELDMSLPSLSKLQNLYAMGKKDSSLGISTSGWFWSSSGINADSACHVYFGSGNLYYDCQYSSNVKAMCVGD